MVKIISRITERSAQPSYGSSISLRIGLALGLSVYYLNYSTTFDEGQIDAASPLTMLGRLLSVMLIVWSLKPFKLRSDASVLLVFLYIAAATSFFLSIAISGETNDILFTNTLIQLPVLVALSATTQRVDYARWFRLVGIILTLQVIGDVIIGLAGDALWLSGAFIGGLGNPSSFGFLCCLLVTFYLFHPKAGSLKWLFVLIISIGAFKSESLFAVISLGIVYFLWMIRRWGWLIAGGLIMGVAVTGIYILDENTTGEQISFIQHKLSAVGALVDAVDYDVESSASVSLRIQIHSETFAAIEDDPLRLFYGHFEGKQYWPMDSQLLTYLGSFGVIMLMIFLSLHVAWLKMSFKNKICDGGFIFISLVLFSLIFLTNRILDYFPVATIYFLLISMAIQSRTKRSKNLQAAEILVGVRKFD